MGFEPTAFRCAGDCTSLCAYLPCAPLTRSSGELFSCQAAGEKEGREKEEGKKTPATIGMPRITPRGSEAICKIKPAQHYNVQ